MKLSACLITRDASSPELQRAIASVRPLVDEVVVVCNAVERPAPVEGVVLDWFTVCNAKKRCGGPCGCEPGDLVDFSALRNRSFQLATGDHLAWLDTDDELSYDDPDALRRLAEEGRPVMAPYEYAYENGKPDTVFTVARMVPRGLATWCYPVHERMSTPGFPEDACVKTTEVVWKHRRTGEAWQASIARNLRIVRHWQDSRELRGDSRFLFYSAQAHEEAKQFNGALGLYHRSYEVQDEPDYRFLTCKRATELLIHMGAHNKAVTWAYRAVESRPDWPTGYFLLGIAYYALREDQGCRPRARVRTFLQGGLLHPGQARIHPAGRAGHGRLPGAPLLPLRVRGARGHQGGDT